MPLNLNDRGMSLPELLLALLITGLITAGAEVAIRKTAFDGGAQRTSRELLTLLSQASSLALATQVADTVILDSNEVVETAGNGRVQLPASVGVEFRFGGASGDRAIAFYPSGAASAGELSISDERQRCSITQTISGARRLECSDAH